MTQGSPEAIAIFAYYGSSGITIVKNSLENGLFDKFYAADGMFDASVIEQIGADNLRDRIWITQAASDDWTSRSRPSPRRTRRPAAIRRRRTQRTATTPCS